MPKLLYTLIFKFKPSLFALHRHVQPVEFSEALLPLIHFLFPGFEYGFFTTCCDVETVIRHRSPTADELGSGFRQFYYVIRKATHREMYFSMRFLVNRKLWFQGRFFLYLFYWPVDGSTGFKSSSNLHTYNTILELFWFKK